MLLLCSCASSQRMFRLSPWSKEQPESPTVQTEAPTEFFNLWPLLCYGNDYTSVMWPLFDNDQYGIAIRPLFNKEYDEYSVLFPLAAWNPVLDKGWTANVYWNQENKKLGCFPLFHLSNNFNLFLNIYWSYRDSGEPDDFGFFPFFHHEYGIRQWLFPAYIHQTIGNEDTLLTPLFGYSERENKLTMLNLLISGYLYYETSGTTVHSILWPFTVFKNDKDKRSFHILPLYSYNSEWPALVNWSKNQKIGNDIKDNFNIFGPLGFMHTTRENDIFNHDRYWSVTRVAKNETDNILLGLIGWGSENYIYWHSKEAEELAWSLYLVEARKYAREENNKSPISELQKEIDKQFEHKIISTMRQLYIQSPFPETREQFQNLRKYLIESESTLYPVDYRHFIPFFRFSRSRDALNWDVLYHLLLSFHNSDDSFHLRINPLFGYANDLKKDNTKLDILWPIFQSGSDKNNQYWNLLWILTESESHMKTDKSHFSILWRIFNYEVNEGKRSGYIFFIPWSI